jgi:undecaprenyl-diphosphatase
MEGARGHRPAAAGLEWFLESWSIAVILGIVEGLTEFIPVSSTGHLIIAGSALGFVGEKAAAFQVAIQLGAILAVVVLYRERFIRLIPGRDEPVSSRPSKLDGWAGLGRLALATVPALVVGFFAGDAIKEHLFTPQSVSIALFAGGIGILAAENQVRRRPTAPLDALSIGQALGIGLFQTLALWPGTSRSAATIIGGLIFGLDRKGAAEFSFLIAVPLIAAAAGHELWNMKGLLSVAEGGQLAVGFGVAFIVALLTVRAFLRMLNRWSLAPFAWYRIVTAPLFYLYFLAAAS